MGYHTLHWLTPALCVSSKPTHKKPTSELPMSEVLTVNIYFAACTLYMYISARNHEGSWKMGFVAGLVAYRTEPVFFYGLRSYLDYRLWQKSTAFASSVSGYNFTNYSTVYYKNVQGHDVGWYGVRGQRRSAERLSHPALLRENAHPAHAVLHPHHPARLVSCQCCGSGSGLNWVPGSGFVIWICISSL